MSLLFDLTGSNAMTVEPPSEESRVSTMSSISNSSYYIFNIVTKEQVRFCEGDQPGGACGNGFFMLADNGEGTYQYPAMYNASFENAPQHRVWDLSEVVNLDPGGASGGARQQGDWIRFSDYDPAPDYIDNTNYYIYQINADI